MRISDEHSEAAWLQSEDARRRLTYTESRGVLDAAEEHLEHALSREAQREGFGPVDWLNRTIDRR